MYSLRRVTPSLSVGGINCLYNLIFCSPFHYQGHVPEADNQLGYVSKAPPQGHRLFCTVKPNFAGSSQSSGNSRHRHASSYTLYVEHLGSLLPILVATRRNTKIRQSFTISLANSVKPRTNGVTPSSHKDFVVNGFVALETPGEHSGEDIHAQTPPRDPREHVTIHPQLSIDIEEEGTTKTTFRGMGIDYHNPGASKETRRTLDSQAPDVLAEVISNMMSSKFRIQGCCHQLPVDIGSVSIKTSLLHIQPRKVTVLLPKVDTCDSGIETDISDSSSEDEDVFDDLLEGNAQISGQTTLRKFSSRRLSSSPDPGIILNSKTPTWNDQHMIYQLDFGGRVTTKSAKNFQLEYGDKQVRMCCLCKQWCVCWCDKATYMVLNSLVGFHWVTFLLGFPNQIRLHHTGSSGGDWLDSPIAF